MVPIRFLTTIFVITFIKLTSSSSDSSWDTATSSFGSKTNDQTKKRLTSGMPGRISQFGGDSMPQSLLHSYEKVDRNDVSHGHENKHMAPSFRSRDDEYQYKEVPQRQISHGHHMNKNHNYKMSLSDNIANERPMMLHSDRLRRKLDEDKGNRTQNSNLTVHNETVVETNKKPNEEHKNGTKKPCIKTHPYKIIDAPMSNATHNKSESTASHTKDLLGKPKNQTVAKNQSVNHTNGTILSINGTNLNSTTVTKEKVLKESNLLDSTLKNGHPGKSLNDKLHGFDLPCNVIGQWISEAGGVTINIKTIQNKTHLDVELIELPTAKKGFLTPLWKINGNLPFADADKNISNDTASTPLGRSIVLTATIMKDPSDNSEGKVAVFLGECRVCYEGIESIMGTWRMKRFSNSCMDVSLSESEIRDVIHRESTSKAKEQQKSERIDTTKPKETTDQSRKKHSHRRRSYDKEGTYRRYRRNSLRHAYKGLSRARLGKY